MESLNLPDSPEIRILMVSERLRKTGRLLSLCTAKQRLSSKATKTVTDPYLELGLFSLVSKLLGNVFPYLPLPFLKKNH